MNENFEAFLHMPIAKKLLVLVGIMGVIIGGYYSFVHGGIADDLRKVNKRIEGKNGLRFKVAEKRGIAANLKQFEEEVERLEIELKKALRELPDKREIGRLLSRVSTVGKDAGLEVRLFKPQEEQKRDYYAEVPVEMEVYGSFHQLATFFDEVGNLDRIVNLDQFNMEQPAVSNEKVTLKTTVVATTFRFLDEAERPKPKAKGRRGKGGARGRRGGKR